MESEVLTEPAPSTVVPTATGCPVAHAPVAPPASVTAPVSGCPVAHSPTPEAAPAGVCPFPHGMTGDAAVRRSHADMVVRKVLRIHGRPEGVTAKSAYSAFERSMLISATRCTLTYVVFPFLLPMFSFAKGPSLIVGIIIGLIAMTCDVFTIRRFFAIDHKWRWYFSAAALSVIGLLSILLVQDIISLLS